MTENRRIFLSIFATYGRSLYALLCGLFMVFEKVCCYVDFLLCYER